MTANQNRAIKGEAIDTLNKMGYLDVYASDSGSDVIIITDTKENIRILDKILLGTMQDAGKGKDRLFVSLGKRNCKKLHITEG